MRQMQNNHTLYMYM